METFTIIRPPNARPKKLLAPTLACEAIAYAEANEQWGLNCGPGALCTMLMLPPEGVRHHIPGFDEKRYTSPTMMKGALADLGVRFREALPMETWEAAHELAGPKYHRFPIYGLARIQFEGPWCNPGVPAAAAYRHTHWVGSMVCNLPTGSDRSPSGQELCIFDVNFLWQRFTEWADLLPNLINETKRATGGWHVTHRWQLILP